MRNMHIDWWSRGNKKWPLVGNYAIIKLIINISIINNYYMCVECMRIIYNIIQNTTIVPIILPTCNAMYMGANGSKEYVHTYER